MRKNQYSDLGSLLHCHLYLSMFLRYVSFCLKKHLFRKYILVLIVTVKFT